MAIIKNELQPAVVADDMLQELTMNKLNRYVIRSVLETILLVGVITALPALSLY